MSVQENQDLELLKQEALDLGVEFGPTIGYDTLLTRIEEKKAEIKAKQEAKKAEKQAKTSVVKKRVIIEARDGDDNIHEQFFGFNGYICLVQFGEEVEIPEPLIEFIKTRGGYVQVKKTVLDDEGIPKNVFTKKWRSRFIVEYK